MNNEAGVTDRQWCVIAHLLASPSTEEACRRARINKTIVYEWLKDENFQRELKRQRDLVNNLARRIERLEEKFGTNREPRVIVITINPDEVPEDPYSVNLYPGGPWAFAIRGGPFTEEIRRPSEKNGWGER
jgi:hypothetical protein